MSWRRRSAILAGVLVGFVALVAVIGIAALTQTDWGREQVRRYVVNRMNASAKGTVSIRRAEGNLLTGLTLHDLVIADSAGQPFVRAERAGARYSIRNLISRQFILSDVELIRPDILLDRQPGQDWNFVRIFPTDTATKAPGSKGVGSAILLKDLKIRDGHIRIRNPWSPSEELTRGERDRAVVEALAGRSRMRIEQVNGGYQSVIDLNSITADLPRLRLADPDSSNILIEVAALRTRAEIFRPHAADIADLAGIFLIGEDSIYVADARVALPGSRFTLEATYALASSALRARINAQPLAFHDLRWIEPRLPEEGGGTVQAAIVKSEGLTVIDADAIDLRFGQSAIQGKLGLALGDTVAVDDTDLRFTRLDTRWIERFAPELDPPANSTVDGRVMLSGTPSAMQLEANLAFTEPRSGTSRIRAVGTIGTTASVTMRNLRITFDPIRVDLIRTYAPSLPVHGVLTGRTTVNGVYPGRVNLVSNVVHTDRSERSHLSGNTTLQSKTGAFSADLRLHSVSLVTVGRFAPSAELHGQASGTMRASGDRREVRVAADLAFAEQGAMTLAAYLDRTRDERFEIETQLSTVDLSSVSARAPSTSLTGNLSARGAGFDPATMRATVTAAFDGLAVDSARVDSVRLDGTVAEGLLSLDRANAHLASARLEANGSFGIARGRTGQLNYKLDIASLADFAHYLPADSGPPVPPRPAVQLARIATARADSLRFARDTEVQRLATGQPPVRALRVDSIRSIPRDSVAGRIVASGQISGGVHEFNLNGEALLDGVVARGNAVRVARVRFGWLNALTPAGTIQVNASLDSIFAGGFVLDSVSADVNYRGDFEGGDRGGTVDIRVVQDERRDYRARADLVLALDERMLRFNELGLRFDSTLWTSTGPGAIRWGPQLFGIDKLELTSSTGSRVFANGTLPADGAGNLQVSLQRVQVGDIIALLQGDSLASALLSVDANLQGTRAAPRIDSKFTINSAMFRGRPIPDAQGTVRYADDRASADASLSSEGRALLTARGELPLRISFTESPRKLEAPISVDVHADSLPLDALPSFTTAIQDVRGRIMGDLAIRGTWNAPDLAGRANLDLASFRVVPMGVTYERITGAIAFAEDRATIDSLVADSRGRGSIRVTGSIDVPELTRPTFDLALNAQNARVLNTERGRITTDARLAIRGGVDSLDITGTVGVRTGVIYLPEQSKKRMVPLDAPAASQVADTSLADIKRLIPKRNPLLEHMRVAVDLTVARDTWIRNSDMNMEIYTRPEDGPVRIRLDQGRGTTDVLGTVNAERGEYTAFGHSFTVSSGAASFTGGSELNPTLHIIAEHQVRLPGREAINIRVHIGGTRRNPTLSLESDAQPPIPQTDLMAYLAFGTSSASLLQQQGSGLAGPGTGSGDLVGGVAALASNQLTGVALSALLDELEGETARQLKLDVFRIRPANLATELSISDNFSTVLLGTEIEAGRYFERRWFVAAQARATLVNPGARVEYIMPSGFRWTISYEPRFMQQDPSFTGLNQPRNVSVLGTFVRWRWRY